MIHIYIQIQKKKFNIKEDKVCSFQVIKRLYKDKLNNLIDKNNRSNLIDLNIILFLTTFQLQIRIMNNKYFES